MPNHDEPQYDVTALVADHIKDRAKILREHLKVATQHYNPESIHQARVAARRLQESLSLAERVEPDFEKLKRRTRRLLKILSPLRTQDALLALVQALSLPHEEALQRVVRRLKSRRAKAQKRAARLLQKRRFQRLSQDARRAAKALSLQPHEPPQGRVAFLSLTSELVSARLRALLEYLAQLEPSPERGAPPSTAALHRARILVKRLRYAWELVRPLALPEATLALRNQLQLVQEVGGHYHDLELLYAVAAHCRDKHPKQGDGALLAQHIAKLAEEERGRFLTLLLPLHQGDFEAKIFGLLDPKEVVEA